MPPIPKPFAELWSTDRGLTVLVVLLVITFFVLPHVAPAGTPGLRLLFDISYSLTLLAGLTAITRTRGIVVTGTALILLALAGRWVHRGIPETELLVFNLSMSMVSTLALAWFLVVQVFRAGPITIHRILGAVGVYLLLGLSWAFAYHLMDIVNPDAFSIAASTTSSILSESEFIYFSFITLTTVGFGDITALDPAVRSLAILEALTGQLFPSILIARLVSMEVTAAHAQQSSREHTDAFGNRTL